MIKLCSAGQQRDSKAVKCVNLPSKPEITISVNEVMLRAGRSAASTLIAQIYSGALLDHKMAVLQSSQSPAQMVRRHCVLHCESSLMFMSLAAHRKFQLVWRFGEA